MAKIETNFELISGELDSISTFVNRLNQGEGGSVPGMIAQKLENMTIFCGMLTDVEKKVQFANFLADHYPEVYVMMTRKLYDTYDVLDWKSQTEENTGLKLVRKATTVLSGCCRISVKMCRKVGEDGIIELLVDILQMLRDYMVKREKQPNDETDDYVENILMTLQRAIRQVPENRKHFRDPDAFELLRRYARFEPRACRLNVLLMLAYIVDQDQNEYINAGNENIKVMVEGLEASLEEVVDVNESDEEKSHVTVPEILAGIIQWAVYDTVKEQFVEQGILSPLKKILGSNRSSNEHELAAQAIWTLSFNTINKEKIQQEKDLIESLESHQQSSDPDVARASSGALWELKDKEEQNGDTSDESKPGHVMIIHESGAQRRMVDVKNKLDVLQYNIWMDVKREGTSTQEDMIEAVRFADVVLICISENYKHSNASRSAAEYAHRLQKSIIPIRVEPDYKPDGWLNNVVGTQSCFDFSSDELVDDDFSNLVGELGDRGKKPDEAQPSTECVESWDKADVTAWLKSNELGHITAVFERYDGKKLLAFKKISETAPEFFYNFLKNQLGFDDMYDIVSLTYAMSKFE
ncbi:uncharacterized protein LOC144438851 [Glandiceps talaboti]